MSLFTPQINGKYARATRCEGSRIFDSDRKSWIDGASGSIACSIGHAHPTVVKAMSDACQQTSFVYRTQFSNPEIERPSARLCEKLGYVASFFVTAALRRWKRRYDQRNSIGASVGKRPRLVF